MLQKQTKLRNFLFWLLVFFSAFFSCIFVLTDRSLEITSAAGMLLAMNGNHLEALCCILLGLILFTKVYRIRDRREKRFAFWGGLVFTLCDMVGFTIYYRDSLFRAENNIFSLALDLACALGAFALFYGILLLIFDGVMHHVPGQFTTPRAEKWFGCTWQSFLVYFTVPMAVYLCLLVFFHPGIITWDSFVQIKEGMGLLPLTDRNPFLHTLMMKYVIRLGTLLLGSVTRGIAFYTAFQCLMISLAVSFTLLYMAKRKIHLGLRIGTLLYFTLHPAIACYSVTLWKDIWLSYFLMLYVLLLIEIVVNPQNFFRKKSHLVVLGLVILGFLFSKNTGIAVLAGTIPFVYLNARKYWKPLSVVFLLCLAVLGLLRLVVIPQMGVIKGSIAEPLSVPIQQIARTCVYEGDTLTEEEIATVSELLPYPYLPELYDPTLSDDVKRELYEENLVLDVMHYAKFWAKLGLSHPRMYLESFLANSCGYWYPDVLYWHIASAFNFTDIDPVPNPGQEAVFKRQNYFIHLYEQLQIVPGIATLLTTAIYFWGCFLLALIAGLKKKYKMLLPLLVTLITWIICIFSPSIAEFRYAFPAVISLPLLTSFILQDDLSLTAELALPGKLSGKKGNQQDPV